MTTLFKVQLCAAALSLLACSDDPGVTTPPLGTAGTSPPPMAASGAAGSLPTAGTATARAGTGASAAAGTRAAGGSAGSTAPLAGAPAAGAAPLAGTSAMPVAGAGMPVAGAGMAGAGAAPASDACDRACLLGVLQGYIDALIAKDPSKLKVSANLKYTENGVVSKLGDTVWKTATMLVAEARLDYADPVEGQVGSMFVFNENTTPVIYMVRLKVVKQEITEIESMAVRRQGAANGFFNPMRMVPEPVFLQKLEPAQRQTREQLTAITDLYLDYLSGDKRANQVPFDMGCKRYENGQVTASGLSSFNAQSWSFDVGRRILIIDEEAGITWGMFPFMQTERALVVGEAFKIIDGKIMMIQAVMANQPAKVWN